MPAKLKVILCWHMHQPAYYANGQYQMPWVYLHAIKDYVDMVAHLEAHPQAHAVINFSPILLEQIDDYAQQVKAYLSKGTSIRDPLLANVCDPLPQDNKDRWQLIDNCSNGKMLERMAQQFSVYRKIQRVVKTLKKFQLAYEEDMINYVDEQFFVDLVMWYHLAWLGETVRRSDGRVQNLFSKKENFNADDRQQLLTIIGDLLSSIIPRYQALADSGQIELSMSPYTHPMIPLLLNMQTAQAVASIDPYLRPQMTAYNKEEWIDWQIEESFAIFKKHFGIKPQGCWVPEGGICEQTVRLLERHGFHWTASDERVLARSLEKHNVKSRPFASHQLPNSTIRCFFRHSKLSDKIGFHSAHEGAGEAIGFITQELQDIVQNSNEESIISIILDGENTWETFPENAYHFLTGLYTTLSTHPDLELTTFAHCCNLKAEEIPALAPGSWSQNATFANWVGTFEGKEGWEQLNAAKRCLEEKRPSLAPEQCAQAERQLAICEGSDWFWWMGQDDPLASRFVDLYHLHLKEFYRLLEE